MSVSPAPSTPFPKLVVQLLDPSFEVPLKTWKFAGQSMITIGRGDDRDVEITNAYVSRHHASLAHEESGWVLLSLGRNGVLIGSQLIDRHSVQGETRFRLGPQGPLLAVRTEIEDQGLDDDDGPVGTISVEPSMLPDFRLDDKRLKEEVTAIADGDYFKQLQRKARELREHRG